MANYYFAWPAIVSMLSKGTAQRVPRWVQLRVFLVCVCLSTPLSDKGTSGRSVGALARSRE